MKLSFSAMTGTDWPEVQRIYAEGIATGLATFESAPPSGWDYFISNRLVSCCLVARDAQEAVAGWAVLAPVSSRPVYRGVAEASVYVAASHRGRRVGDELLGQLIAVAEDNGIWTMQSSTFPQNLASVALQQRHGFLIVGLRRKIGRMSYGPMSGRWCDTLLLERRSTRIGLD
ncbi:MAG: GNAT family N-acetyltransferase [Opitutales bacterium]